MTEARVVATGDDAGRTELAARRMVMLSAGVVAVTTAAIAAVLLHRDGDRSLPAWFLMGAIAVAALYAGLGILSPGLSAGGLRRGGAVAVAAYLVLLVAFLPAQAATPDLDRIPWFMTASGAVVIAALLAGGSRLAWIVLAVTIAATTGYRYLVGGMDLDGVVNDAQAALTGSVICVIGGFLLTTSRELDLAADAATEASALAAAEHGRLAARTRAAALVHDEVLATLTLAGADLPLPPGRLAEQAVGAAGMVSSLARDHGAPIVPLRDALAQEGARFCVPVTIRGNGEPALDPTVRDALVGATRQALENSVRHAGAGVPRALSADLDDDRILIEVTDDGIGFDPGTIPPDRMGVRLSIVGRMRDVAGGAAHVASVPGGGTRIRLVWEPPAPTDLAAAGRDDLSLTRGLALIAGVFVVGQTLSAIGSALTTSPWWAPVLILLGILVAAEVLRRDPSPLPGIARVAFFLAITVGVVVWGIALVPYSYGTIWFGSAAGFLLVALALRGRTGMALLGLASIVLVLAAAGISAGAALIELGWVVTRPVILVGLAVLLLQAVTRMQRRAAALHRRAQEAAQRAAWDAAAHAESALRAADLDERVVPLLDRIGQARPLSPEEKRACVALEGELRDEYRAGVLAREPLVAAVAAARRRGVDVVLFDDRGGALDEATLDAVAGWMADALPRARVRVVGRLLPEGRAGVATIAVDGETTDFGG
ncbi:MAG: hypothetical protein NT132_06220 [Microbacterium sp.]|uniref:sensor histidine kinase n=1 Tax=Microbacterium sp. TaxID=51671 RepID=UPI002609DBE2|nr:ATP-binding protein [Microbacterium sp.]MCX6501988.1 hypothetical protein [Microbacterium sp.]